MTEQIYHKDPYLKELDATVKDIQGNKVLLDKTIFIPDTNTEPGDIGKINNIKISGSRKEGKDIWHMAQREINFQVGDTVKLEVHWVRRHKIMRLHSALHLLAGVFDSKFGERAVAGVVKKNNAYLVFKHKLPDDIIDKAITEANTIVKSNVNIKTYEDEKREGFRWCGIGDLPPIPCGGLHVKSSEEIKEIRLLNKQMDGVKEKITIELESY